MGIEGRPVRVGLIEKDHTRLTVVAPDVELMAAVFRPAVGRLADHLEDLGAKAPALRDLAGTLGFNRSHLTYRAAIAADSRNQLISRLRGLAGPEREDEDGVSAEQLAGVVTGQAVQEPKLMFVFTGQGGQWWAMGRELLDKDPLFRETVEEFDAVFAKLAGWSVVEELRRPERNSRIHATRITQPAIFAVQIGLLARLRAWGVEPEGVLGHSFGEVAAAYATGALSLRDGQLQTPLMPPVDYVTRYHYRDLF